MSNYLLSIVIPVLNDPDEVNATIASIRQTTGNDTEIIVVDDHSDKPVEIKDRRVMVHRNNERLGAGASKHLGATFASSNYILLLDCHMRFEPNANWLNKALNRIVGRQNTVHCAACLGLDEKNMDVTKFNGLYSGATLSLYNEKSNEIFEGKWMDKSPEGDDYDIACLMGAGYFFPKQLFMKLRGMAALKMWGTEEQYISVKAWLSGAEIKMLNEVRIGHKFRSEAPYVTGVPNLVYNKLWAINTLLDPDLAKFLISKIPKNGDLAAAQRMFNQNRLVFEEHQRYYQNLFVRDIYWYCDKFNIPVPDFKNMPAEVAPKPIVRPPPPPGAVISKPTLIDVPVAKPGVPKPVQSAPSIIGIDSIPQVP